MAGTSLVAKAVGFTRERPLLARIRRPLVVPAARLDLSDRGAKAFPTPLFPVLVWNCDIALFFAYAIRRYLYAVYTYAGSS